MSKKYRKGLSVGGRLKMIVTGKLPNQNMIEISNSIKADSETNKRAKYSIHLIFLYTFSLPFKNVIVCIYIDSEIVFYCFSSRLSLYFIFSRIIFLSFFSTHYSGHYFYSQYSQFCFSLIQVFSH
jgi:hypothetical protein